MTYGTAPWRSHTLVSATDGPEGTDPTLCIICGQQWALERDYTIRTTVGTRTLTLTPCEDWTPCIPHDGYSHYWITGYDGLECEDCGLTVDPLTVTASVPMACRWSDQ